MPSPSHRRSFPLNFHSIYDSKYIRGTGSTWGNTGHAPAPWHSRKMPEVTGKSLVSGWQGPRSQGSPPLGTPHTKKHLRPRGLCGRGGMPGWGSRAPSPLLLLLLPSSFLLGNPASLIISGGSPGLQQPSQPPTHESQTSPFLAKDSSGARLPTLPSH